MVTHQLQVQCRPVKVCRSETDVLPLSYTANKELKHQPSFCCVTTAQKATEKQRQQKCFSGSSCPSKIAEILTVFDSSLPDSMILRQSGIISVVSRKFITSCSSVYEQTHLWIKLAMHKKPWSYKKSVKNLNKFIHGLLSSEQLHATTKTKNTLKSSEIFGWQNAPLNAKWIHHSNVNTSSPVMLLLAKHGH